MDVDILGTMKMVFKHTQSLHVVLYEPQTSSYNTC